MPPYWPKVTAIWKEPGCSLPRLGVQSKYAGLTKGVQHRTPIFLAIAVLFTVAREYNKKLRQIVLAVFPDQAKNAIF